MNNTIPFHSATHAPQITVDVNILSMLKQAASCLTEMASENVYLAAIGPNMELTIIVEEDAPSVLPCFDESGAGPQAGRQAAPDRSGHLLPHRWAQYHRVPDSGGHLSLSDLSGKSQHHPDGRWAEADLHPH